MKPTRRHYFIAEARPTTLWFRIFPLCIVGFFIWLWWPILLTPTSPRELAMEILHLLLLWVLGRFLGILVGWPIFGPLYHSAGIENGAPFQPGENVHILTGPTAITSHPS